MLDCILGNLYGVLISRFGIYRYAHLLAQYLQLVDSGRTINIACNKQNLTAFVALDVRSQFAGESGLSRTLQTRNKNHGRVAFKLDFGSFATHQCSKFVTHNLGHHLTRLNRFEHILTKCLLLHIVGKRLGYLVVDIGIDQRTTNLFEGLRNINLCNSALTFQNFE